MRDKADTQIRFCIKYNNAAVNGVCPVCGGRTDPGIPFAIFPEGEWSDICDECAEKYVPEMQLMVREGNQRGLLSEWDATATAPDDYFGEICPTCETPGEWLNVGKVHFIACHNCKQFVFVGANLFSNWRHESEETWRENEARMRDYAERPGTERPVEAFPF